MKNIKSEITITYPAGEGSRDKVLTYEKKRSTKYKDELDHEIHKRPKPEDE